MEQEIKDNKYFFIWLYISILLHILVILIMACMKQNSSSKDPDPASMAHESQVIFVQEQPELTPDEPEPQDYKLASRTQGGTVGFQADNHEHKDPEFDVPAPALSPDYKTGLENQTTSKDQDDQGIINIPDQAMLDLQKQPEPENLVERPDEPEPAHSPIYQAALQQAIQKVTSTKHRPAEIGSQNLSKVQLSKLTEPINNTKSKLSLVDLQKGFSQFIQNHHTTMPAPSTSSTLGNSLYFSTTGNDDQDNLAGLKFASYMSQAGKMYQSSGNEYIDMIRTIIQKEGVPSSNNQIMISIDRSGKVIACVTTLSCGNPVIDNYHIKMVESIGSFPPIPKYIPAPLHVHAYIPFQSLKMMSVRKP